MKDEPNPVPQDASQTPGAPVANMGMGQPMAQPNMGQAHIGQNVGQQNMGQANMANMGQQQNVTPPNMNQTMSQSLGQQNIAQQAQQQIAQIDMSNIDPSIGLQPMPTHPMGNMGNMPGAGRGMNMQGGQIHNDKIEEVPQEM